MTKKETHIRLLQELMDGITFFSLKFIDETQTGKFNFFCYIGISSLKRLFYNGESLLKFFSSWFTN